MKFNIESSLKKLLSSKSWKTPFIGGVIALGVLVLLDSVLFTVMVALIKLVLMLGAVVLLCYTAYLAYPTLVKKVQEARKA
jgi:hypothetical protein